MPDRRTFIIDTDTASDDAVALVMALRHPDVEVVAITVVAGNVPLPEATQNALYVVELCGASVPVHAGSAAPLSRPLRTAQHVHGRDGMGDIGLPLQGRVPASDDGVQVLVDEINRRPASSVTLITLGPLTNVARALAIDPSIAGRVGEIVMMGGTGDAVGNITAVAEFNIWVDPEAAAIVFACGAKLTMVGWDISRTYAVIEAPEVASLREVGPLGAFSMSIQGTVSGFVEMQTHLGGFDLPDPIAMAVALDRSVATRVEPRNVRVETEGRYTTGQTVVDHIGVESLERNVDVVLEASRERFLALLHETHREA